MATGEVVVVAVRTAIAEVIGNLNDGHQLTRYDTGSLRLMFD